MADIRHQDGGSQAGQEFEPATARSSAADFDAMSNDLARMFQQAAEQTRMAICISDARAPDMPIVFANQAFLHLTGYEREDVLGRNCRFLQGPDTDPETVARVRDGLDDERVRVTILRNYRKDGTPFWNSLHIGPIFDRDGELTHFYGSQWDVTELLEERDRMAIATRLNQEMEHRSRNLFGVISAMIRLSVKSAQDKYDLADKLSERVVALSRAHAVSSRTGGHVHEADLRELIDAILLPYEDGARDRIAVIGDTVTLDKKQVTPLGLVLHELATNALKYGALSTADGAVAVDWTQEDGKLVLIWRETGGPALDDGEPGQSGSGSRIMLGVLSNINATMKQDWEADGLVVRIAIPVE
ncbi:PAS domain-containing protein [uncultured Croceicoccus sp.]|uniref:PAS domain-containing protein n=1 Tax=uncultured Croceicoccus sp. TaxID=1295329 RepID=UPI00262BDA55|nr:PAS domain-containing protein [uncultured Croceicoccus sp.]